MFEEIMNPLDIQPKHILKFLETRSERAIEVLREIVDANENRYINAQLANALSVGQMGIAQAQPNFGVLSNGTQSTVGTVNVTNTGNWA